MSFFFLHLFETVTVHLNVVMPLRMNDTNPHTTAAVVICECYTNKTAAVALYHFHLPLKLTLYVNLYAECELLTVFSKKNWLNCGEMSSAIRIKCSCIGLKQHSDELH